MPSAAKGSPPNSYLSMDLRTASPNCSCMGHGCLLRPATPRGGGIYIVNGSPGQESRDPPIRLPAGPEQCAVALILGGEALTPNCAPLGHDSCNARLPSWAEKKAPLSSSPGPRQSWPLLPAGPRQNWNSGPPRCHWMSARNLSGRFASAWARMLCGFDGHPTRRENGWGRSAVGLRAQKKLCRHVRAKSFAGHYPAAAARRQFGMLRKSPIPDHRACHERTRVRFGVAHVRASATHSLREFLRNRISPCIGICVYARHDALCTSHLNGLGTHCGLRARPTLPRSCWSLAGQSRWLCQRAPSARRRERAQISASEHKPQAQKAKHPAHRNIFEFFTTV